MKGDRRMSFRVIPGPAKPEPGTHEHGRRQAGKSPRSWGSRLRGSGERNAQQEHEKS